MDIFDYYRDAAKHKELEELFNFGAQQHPDGLAANFLEKDIWVTEILRLLFDEKLMGDFAIAFKGGTALSKCWKAIHRFSEDIDLSIHWADLAHAEDEALAWQETTSNRSQRDKFRDAQTARLTQWSISLTNTLNKRLAKYGIEGLSAELDESSHGEKIHVHFPQFSNHKNSYSLDHILLEFGGRNRGKPTQPQSISCYLSDIPALQTLQLPTANVSAFEPEYILWEKLTALHQFSTQEKEPNPSRLARHWYDSDCLLINKIADPLSSTQAMIDVVEMKQHRWPQKGVDYESILKGKLKLIPDKDRLQTIASDHEASVKNGLFFKEPIAFQTIIERLKTVEDLINSKNRVGE